jgi:hypothetical protein
MASQGQIAANRRNARKSTGPRSGGGKKRASKNALRHGLSIPFQASAAQAKRIEKLAGQIAGPRREGIALELACVAASATFDLARVRQVKAQLLKGASALGSVDPPPICTSSKEEVRYLKLALRTKASPPRPTPPDPLATIPCDEADRTAEAIRRALPELAKLDRYEARAVARRDRAIRAMVNLKLD